MSDLRYPIVVNPALLEAAEARIRAFPHLAYDWAIRYAHKPLRAARPERAARVPKEIRLQMLDHRNRTQHARRAA